MSKTQCLAAVEKFLEKRVKIAPGYERAQASAEDTESLELLIRTLINTKWEPSYSGDLPVEFTLVNRTTHERMHFQPLPYEENRNKVELANMNLQIAASSLDLSLRLLK